MLSIFYTKESLFNGLKARKSDACKALISKVEKPIAQIARNYGLSDYDIEDFIQYCVLEQMECILDGRYTYQGNWVSSFTVNDIAARRIHDYVRVLRGKTTVDLTEAEKVDFEAFKEDSDLQTACKTIFLKLCKECQQLVMLTHRDNFSDEVILEAKLTKHTTLVALRKARSRCYEDFTSIAAAANLFTKKLEQLNAKKEAKKFKTIKKIKDDQPK
jgi:hypothetical protein